MSDLAWLSAAFSDALRRAGVPATAEASGRFAQAVGLLDPVTVGDLYWAARITLVTDLDQLETFERVFRRVFAGMTDTAARRGDQAFPSVRPHPRNRPETSRARPRNPERPAVDADISTAQASLGLRAGEDGTDDPDAREIQLVAASAEERLATTDFSELDADELADLHRLMRQMRLSPPMRQGRRSRRHRAGDRLDVRATLRRSHRTGGDPVVQVRRRRAQRPRRLVVLCDISGSMEPYARAYLGFLHAAAGTSRAEVFALATRLTRLTRSLGGPSPQVALARAAAATPDWRGGTRLGETLKAFIDEHGRRGVARSAVVVIVSDGWEGSDPELLGEQMERLSRLAFRIVWVNPRTADPRYQPLVAGMAAALPYCDVVVSGHSVAALGEVVAAISRP